MIFYHGTAADLALNILKEGLVPQKRRNWTFDGEYHDRSASFQIVPLNK